MSESKYEVIPKQYITETYAGSGPTYKLERQLMYNNLGTEVPIQANSSVSCQWRLPYSTAHNMSRSRVSGKITVPAVAGNNTFMIAEGYPFCGAFKFGPSNAPGSIIDIASPTKFSKIMTKLTTKYTDFLTRDTSEFVYPSRKLEVPSLDIQCVSTLGGANPVAGTFVTIPGSENVNDTFSDNNVLAGGFDATISKQTLPYNECQHYNISGVNTINTILFDFCLGDLFPETFASVDKDLVYGTADMILDLNISGWNQWLFSADKTTGFIGADPTLVKLTDMYLNLAVQTNVDCIKAVQDKYNSEGGIKLLYTNPIIYRAVSQDVSTNQAITCNLLSSYGKTLKKVITTCWSSKEYKRTTLDNNNTNGLKIASYNTLLEGKKLQDELVECATGSKNSAYKLNKEVLEGTLLFNEEQYMKSFCHVDSFDSPSLEKQVCNGEAVLDNLIVGKPMTTNLVYSFAATATGVAYVYNVIALYQNLLSISKNGVMNI